MSTGFYQPDVSPCTKLYKLHLFPQVGFAREIQSFESLAILFKQPRRPNNSSEAGWKLIQYLAVVLPLFPINLGDPKLVADDATRVLERARAKQPHPPNCCQMVV